MTTAEQLVRNRVVRLGDFPGRDFTRFLRCIGLAGGATEEAVAIAEERYDSSTASHVKAAVGAVTTSDVDFSAPSAQEILRLARTASVFGRFSSLARRVGFNAGLRMQTSSPTLGWITDGLAIPAHKWAFTAASLPMRTLGGLYVTTVETLEDPAPEADQLMRDEIVAALRDFLDTALLDPSVAAVAGVSPASITNGATSSAASGTDAAAARADLADLFGDATEAGFRLDESVLFVRDRELVTLGLLLGHSLFELLDRVGLTLLVTPAADDNIILAHGPSVLVAETDRLAVSVARHASVQMDDAPTQDAGTPTASTSVSLWQTNSVGFRLAHSVNWEPRSGAVRYISGVAYA